MITRTRFTFPSSFLSINTSLQRLDVVSPLARSAPRAEPEEEDFVSLLLDFQAKHSLGFAPPPPLGDSNKAMQRNRRGQPPIHSHDFTSTSLFSSPHPTSTSTSSHLSLHLTSGFSSLPLRYLHAVCHALNTHCNRRAHKAKPWPTLAQSSHSWLLVQSCPHNLMMFSDAALRRPCSGKKRCHRVSSCSPG